MTRRHWVDARYKVDQEGRCRLAHLGGCDGPLEAAHTISRRYDSLGVIAGVEVLLVDDRDIAPLCKHHHEQYDTHQVDLLPALTFDEMAAAVRHVGIESARRRLAPSVYQAEQRLRMVARDAESLGGAA